jgi:hypothetical protein
MHNSGQTSRSIYNANTHKATDEFLQLFTKVGIKFNSCPSSERLMSHLGSSEFSSREAHAFPMLELELLLVIVLRPVTRTAHSQEQHAANL